MSIRVGIIGCGDAGKSFACATHHVEDVELQGMVDVDADRAAQATERLGGKPLTFDELLAEEPDVVAIATPPGLHAAQAMRCLEAGAHVLIEKPMALAVEDCDRVIGAAEERGLRVMVGQTWRYRPDVLTFIDRIRSGDYGDLFALVFRRSAQYFSGKRVGWQVDPELSGGGIAMNLFIHAVDTMRYMAGAEVADFHGSVGHHKPGFVIDSDLFWLGRHENDVTATIIVNGLGHRDVFGIEAHCSRGTLVMRPRELIIDAYVDGEHAEQIDTGDTCARTPDGISAHHGYIAEWREMVEAVERGGAIRSDGRNGRENVRIARALMERCGVEMPAPRL